MQIVTPHEVSSENGFDYNIMIEQFGLQHIDDNIIKSIKQLSDDIHPLLSRNIFYAHQDFDKILAAKKSGKPVYIYTGRGPSADSLHLGHLVPMMFTAWLQKILDCWVVIEMSDEEKFYFKSGTLRDFMSYTKGNALDIIACGFNVDKTFIFSSFKYGPYMKPLIASINKRSSVHVAKKIYGFKDDVNLGQISWAPYEQAPAMCGAFPHLFGDRRDVMCLVPCAIDQAPYFRSGREMAASLGYPKPALICSKFLPGLSGINNKASTTGNIPSIFLNDNRATITKNIRKFAFSGGRDTIQEQRLLGANLQVDIAYIYLVHFLSDDEMLEKISTDYATGKLLSGEIKNILIDVIDNIVKEHQSIRSKIDDITYNKFFTMRIQESCQEYFNQYKNEYIDISID
ncbi:tryptophanyl-tRNA synthetase [Acanthamoeba polyphaga mimivirus]|uniref:tryptophan--tRNA ligase n=3 Tax=Megamimivirinae TaxID=3044648 RepID=A0A2L2DNB9_MIMIV|nr:tyrosyl-tRNA synthetase [Megavirus chiliensis]AEQ32410.1 tryptophanyl-tRNA synthetase [Megavirus chiliensis]AFX92949.1 tryptophanyl-tRNA synthetase [Megavirus courdo11]AVG46568.1 tryptophanyl-tRNA synthetase [Acanthamoeba polyphaga mimivirus]AVG47679.1 tryptophanyl-tRNA synthetase [Acanthamoeba polyphaga mimivirus]